MLTGDLATVSLAGLLQLLSAERRSGRLRVIAAQGEGLVWLEEGRVVHAERRGEADGEAAVHATVLSERGRFEFELGVAPPRRTITSSTDHLLMEAACQKDHRGRGTEAQLEADAVPVFAPVPEGTSPPRFSTLQWRLLACVDGEADITMLASRVGLAVPLVQEMVADLVKADVLGLQ